MDKINKNKHLADTDEDVGYSLRSMINLALHLTFQ